MITKELLEVTMNALERLMKMFAIERYVYLALTVISFLLLLYTAYIFVATKTADRELLIAMFGGSGLIAASSFRITLFFNKAFTLIENLLKRVSI